MHMIIQTTKEINGVLYDYAYSDSGYMIERDGVTYLCNRSTGQPVYNALAELVGHYFVEVG